MIELDRSHLVSWLGLQSRDIRVVDASYRNLPAILVRDSAILLNLEVLSFLSLHFIHSYLYFLFVLC